MIDWEAETRLSEGALRQEQKTRVDAATLQPMIWAYRVVAVGFCLSLAAHVLRGIA